MGVAPVCPTPFDEPVLSGSPDGGTAGSGVTVGETGVASGFVPGTVFGVVFGVKFGLVPGVTFGLVPVVAFGLVPGVTFGFVPGTAFGDTGVVSGGMVLLGFVVVLLGLVVWVRGIELCDCAFAALPVRACAKAQQPHSRSMLIESSSLRFILSPLVQN